MQKTAYEMRISDWSSDVCSSDLSSLSRLRRDRQSARPEDADRRGCRAARPGRQHQARQRRHPRARVHRAVVPAGARRCRKRRSEEHTSELQSLMRISYAVFCLKKKKMNKNNTPPTYMTSMLTHT